MTVGGRPGPGPRPRPVVEADLLVQVTDASGGTGRVEVTGDEHGLSLDVDRPEIVLATLPAGPRAADAFGAARALGFRIEVRGPRGRLAVLDPDRPSRLAGLLTGEPTLRVTPAAVGAWARGPGRRPLVGGIVALALGAAAIAIAARRPTR